MRMLRVVGIAGTVLSLVACGQTDFIRTVPQTFASADDTDDFPREAAARDIPVIVRGRAFGSDPKALETAILERMRGAAWGVNPHFTTAPIGNSDATYSLVFLVGGSDRVNALALCTDSEAFEPTPAPRAGDSMRLFGALCRFGKTVMSVAAYADRIDGFDDPRFRTLVASATLDLTRGEQRTNRLKRDN